MDSKHFKLFFIIMLERTALAAAEPISKIPRVRDVKLLRY